MKALRIKLLQSQASYTREETVNNRMTYPLPPYSTVIGALHAACGYTEYHPMDISVQGRYGAMQQEVYVNHTLLNRTEDDRGLLIWLGNANSLNTGYIVVAEALANNASFRREQLIRIRDKALLKQYQALKDRDKAFDMEKNTVLKPLETAWKKEKKELKSQLKSLDKNSSEYRDIAQVLIDKEEQLNKKLREFENRRHREYAEPYSHFRVLTKGPQKQEVLYDVELVIHVRAEETVLQDIMNHKYDLVSLGRSEDFVELIEMEYCDIVNSVDAEYELPQGYAMFIHADRVNENQYFQYFEQNDSADQSEVDSDGTIYYVSKDYQIINDRRVFKHIPCLYSSTYVIDGESRDVLFDRSGGYLVDFN